MEPQSDEWHGWESQEQVDARLAEFGRKRSSAALWRRRGLLQKVEVEARGRGSIVRHPPGTCAQIAAIARLLEDKSDLNFVGRRLWWEGYSVDDRYWLPQFTKLAGHMDRVFSILGPLMLRYNRDEQGETLGDQLARANISNTVFSRIERRLPTEQIAQLFGTVLEVALGTSIGIEIPGVPPPPKAIDDETRRQRDADWMVRALDMGAADEDSILGQKFKFRKAMPETFATLSEAFATGSFSELTSRRDPIFAARDDIRNALSIGTDMYEAFKDIYGDGAFGLRLLAWIADKEPELTIAMMILGMARLRQTRNDLYSSSEIAQMAKEAKKCHVAATAINVLREQQPFFVDVLSRRRLKLALASQADLNIWREEFAILATRVMS